MTKTAKAAGRKAGARNRPTDQLRQDILNAAQKVFARDGVDGASLTDIAALAETKHPVILYHFGSKEGLWRAVMAHIYEALDNSFSTVLNLSRDLSALDSLRMFVRMYVQFSARHPDRPALILNNMHSNKARMEWLASEYLQGLHRKLNALLDRVEAEGQLKPIPRHHLVYILTGSISTLFISAPMVHQIYGVDVYDPGVVEAHADWIIDMLLSGLQAPPDASPA